MMKFGLTLGAIFLASNVAFAQVAIDMTTLERRYEDAQAAFDRNPSSADRQQLTDLRDELGYLRTKQRLGDQVTRADRQRLSDHLDRYLSQKRRRTYVLPASTTGRTTKTAPARATIELARRRDGSRFQAAAKSTCGC